jgi:hypothetical protein
MSAQRTESWSRERIEETWDALSLHGMAYDRQSMYNDEGADSEFCEGHRRALVEALERAELVPRSVADAFAHALGEIKRVTGTSTEAWHIATRALSRSGRGDRMSAHRDNIDSKVMREIDDRAIGLNCGDAGGGFLTFIDATSSEQVWVSRADLEWLRDVGIPAWLKEMADANG